MKIFVVAAGRCGRALAGALDRAGHDVLGTWNRTEAAANRVSDTPWPRHFGPDRPQGLAEADVVWVTALDRYITEVSRWALGPHQVALHASGAVPARALRLSPDRPASVAACHPIQSFADDMAPPEHVRGVYFGIQGEERAARVGFELVRDMSGVPFEVADEDAKALYHAACCVASNALVALADQAVALFHAAGVPRGEALRALSPLIRGTAENLGRASEARDVLTGPIARGDEDVVRRHEQAIASRIPEAADDYRAVCEAIRKMKG